MLKFLIDSLDEVDASLHTYYKEVNGKFQLDVTGIRTDNDVSAVQNALNMERNDHKKTKTKLEEYAGIRSLNLSPTEILDKLDRFEELEAVSGDKIDDEKLNKMVETRIKSRIAPLERERDQLKAVSGEQAQTIGEFQTKDRNRKISDVVRQAATEQKIVPSAVEDVLMIAERSFELSEDGTVMAKDGVGVTPGIDPTVWLTEMQQKRPHWWPQSQGGGGSGGSGGSGNPWSSSAWNMSEQGRVYRENPARAQQLAISAGTTIGGLKPAIK